MAEKAETTFKIKEWQEEMISEQGVGKIVRAHVVKSYTGDLEGDGVVEYLMAYTADGSTRFVGYETVTGSLKERAGSFVFEHTGTFDKGVVNSVWYVVDGSGAEALSGLSGTVSFSAGHQEEYRVVLNYEL
jgi:hypothetical protein